MVITLYGNNDFLLKQELNKLITEFKNLHGNLAVEQFDEDAELSLVLGSINNVGLFADNKLIVLNGISASKEISGKIEEIIEKASELSKIIIVERKLDKRSQYYKLLFKKTDFRELLSTDSKNIAAWIEQYVKSKGGKISLADAQYLSDKAGFDQLKLSSEIEKLLIVGNQINRHLIDELIEDSVNNTIFELIDASFNGQVKRALTIYENVRLQKLDPQQIVAMLAWQLNILSLLKFSNKPINQVAKDRKQNPFVLQKYSVLANKLPISVLKRLINSLFIIDKETKTKSIDPDEALKNYIISLAF